MFLSLDDVSVHFKGALCKINTHIKLVKVEVLVQRLYSVQENVESTQKLKLIDFVWHA